jgi:hypothetical protein
LVLFYACSTTSFFFILGADAFVQLHHHRVGTKNNQKIVPRSIGNIGFESSFVAAPTWTEKYATTTNTNLHQKHKSKSVVCMMASSDDDDSTTITATTTTLLSNEDGVPSSPLDRPVLSMIDAVSLLIFSAIGKASHSAADGSLDILAVFVTALPFVLSWFIISPLVGCYKPEATKDVKSAAVQATKGWAIAIPVGCILRGIIKGYVPPIPFVIVTLIATLFILCLGRIGYTALAELYVEMF